MWINILLLSASSQTCPIFGCHQGGVDISPTCATLTPDNNIVLQICDGSQTFCDTRGSIAKNHTCMGGPPPHPVGFKYPGEHCFQNSDCVTNTCTNNVCIGQSPGGACVGNSDCDVGLYCGSGFYCVPQLPYGSSCTNDYQCQNNLACNRTIFDDGVCVGYFSIPIGGYVGICQNMLTEGVSNLCQTGACFLLNPGYDTLGVCHPPYMNLHAYPWACTSDVDCIGYNGDSSVQGTCSCGMSSTGTAYCDSFSNDPPGFTVNLLSQVHVNSSSMFNCHTQRRFDIDCLRQNLGPAQVGNFLFMTEELTDTARYVENDFCAEHIYNYNHFNPRNYHCPAYGCGQADSWLNGTCVTFAQAGNRYEIQTCNSPSTPFCDISISEANKWQNVSCKAAPGNPIKYPGDPCSSNFDCISGNCTGNVCQGIQLGRHCQSSQSCNVGLYCASSNYQFTCQPLIQPYNFGCGSDFDCVNWCGCRFTSGGPPGTCVPYFSLAQNSTVQCSSSGISYLCSTGACYAQGSSMYGLCTKAPVSQSALPTQCMFDGQCIGKNTLGQSFRGSCTCGYNTMGSSYCSVFSGDAPGVTFFKTLKKILTNTTAVSLCQTTRRLQFDCFNVVANYMGASNTTWYLQMLNFTNYPYYIGNDECTKQVYTKDFWGNVGILEDRLEIEAQGLEGVKLESK